MSGALPTKRVPNGSGRIAPSPAGLTTRGQAGAIGRAGKSANRAASCESEAAEEPRKEEPVVTRRAADHFISACCDAASHDGGRERSQRIPSLDAVPRDRIEAGRYLAEKLAQREASAPKGK